MTVSHGQDPEKVDAVGQALSALGGRVEDVAQSGTGSMGLLVQAWEGPDTQYFQSAWEGARTSLGEAAEALRAVGELARQQAADQQAASEGGGATGGLMGGAAATAAPRTDSDIRPESENGHRERGQSGAPGFDDLPIPAPDAPGTWIPQGMSVTDDGQYVITTFYNQDDGQGDQGILAIQPVNGGPIEYVRLGGNDHYGGVTVSGDNVYVSGNGEIGPDGSYVQRYSLEDLLAAGGTDIPQSAAPQVDPVETIRVPTGSTVTVDGDSLYVVEYSNGYADDYEPGSVYRYDLGPDGQFPGNPPGFPTRDPAMPMPSDTFEAPPNTQGVTVHDGDFFFVQSGGAGRPSSIIHVDPETGTQTTVHDDLSPLSQGIDVVDGEFVITSESGSGDYAEEVIDAGMEPADSLQTRSVPRDGGP